MNKLSLSLTTVLLSTALTQNCLFATKNDSLREDPEQGGLLLKQNKGLGMEPPRSTKASSPWWPHAVNTVVSFGTPLLVGLVGWATGYIHFGKNSNNPNTFGLARVFQEIDTNEQSAFGTPYQAMQQVPNYNFDKWALDLKNTFDSFTQDAGGAISMSCNNQQSTIHSGKEFLGAIGHCKDIGEAKTGEADRTNEHDREKNSNTHNGLGKHTKECIEGITEKYVNSQSALTRLSKQPDDSQLASFCKTPGERAAVEICLRKQCPFPSGMSERKINYERGLRLALSMRGDLTRFCGGESELDQFLKEYGTNCQTVIPERPKVDQKTVAMAIKNGVTHAESFALAAKDWASVYGATDPSMCVTSAASDIISYISRRPCSQELQTVTVESPSRLEGKQGLHITVENVPVFLKESMQEMSRILETFVKGSKTRPDGFAMTIKIENVGPYDLQNIASAGPSSTYEGTAITKTCGMNLSTDFVLGGVMKKRLDPKAGEPLDTLVHEGLHCLFDWNNLGVLDENGKVITPPYNKALQPMLQKFEYKNNRSLYLLVSEPCKQYMRQLERENPHFSNLYQKNDPRIGYEGMPTTGDDHTSRAMLRIAPPNALQYVEADVLDGSIQCIAKSLEYILDTRGFAAKYPDLVPQNPHKPYNATFDYLGELSN